MMLFVHCIAAALVWAITVAGIYITAYQTASRTEQSDILTALHLSDARDMMRQGRWVSADEIDQHDVDLLRPHKN